MIANVTAALAGRLDALCTALGMRPLQDPEYQLRGRWGFWLKNLLTGKPHLTIHRGEYLRRWWILPKNRWCNVYLHHFTGPDQGPWMHDHPYDFVSVILRGGYLEKRFRYPATVGFVARSAGDAVDLTKPETVLVRRDRFSVGLRRAGDGHHIERLLSDDKGVWTLVITGPATRVWGFYTERGWKPWKQALGIA